MEDGLAGLQGQYDDALKKKADLEASVENTNKKLERATTVREAGRRRGINRAVPTFAGGSGARRIQAGKSRSVRPLIAYNFPQHD